MSTVLTKLCLHVTPLPQFIHVNKANSDTIYHCISVDRSKEFKAMVIHHDESRIISHSGMMKSQRGYFTGVIFESKQKFFLVLTAIDKNVLDIDVEIQYYQK